MLTIFSLGFLALACIVFIPQTLGYCIERFEQRNTKCKKAKYWDGDNWLCGFFTLLGMVVVLGLVFILGLIMCLIFGITPL